MTRVNLRSEVMICFLWLAAIHSLIEVVSADEAAAGADDFFVEYERRGEGKLSFCGGVARGLPADFSIGDVEGGDEWVCAGVAAKNEQTPSECGGTAVAVERWVGERGLFPEDFAGEVQRGGAHVAKVDE